MTDFVDNTLPGAEESPLRLSPTNNTEPLTTRHRERRRRTIGEVSPVTLGEERSHYSSYHGRCSFLGPGGPRNRYPPGVVERTGEWG